jgi:hypothetical protein
MIDDEKDLHNERIEVRLEKNRNEKKNIPNPNL